MTNRGKTVITISIGVLRVFLRETDSIEYVDVKGFYKANKRRK